MMEEVSLSDGKDSLGSSTSVGEGGGPGKMGGGGDAIIVVPASSAKLKMSRDKSSGSHFGGEKRASNKIQPSSASSHELLAKMAAQYSLYCHTDLSAQISRLEEYLQESIAKLEEQQSLFEIKEIETREWTQVILPQLVKQAQIMSTGFNKRLDSLNELIVSIKIVLDQLEKQIVIAEQRMGLYPASSSFRSVFKYFMKTDVSTTQPSESQDTIGWDAVKGHLVCDDPLNLSTYLKS